MEYTMKQTLILMACSWLAVEGSQPSKPKFNLFNNPLVSNLKLPKIEDVKRFAYYAAASICSDTQLQNWDCKACIKAGGKTTKLLGTVEAKFVGAKAYVAVNQDTKEIVVGFRGGSEFVNPYQAIGGGALVPFFPYIKDIFTLVHVGFSTVAGSLGKGVEAKLKPILNDERFKDYKIVFTGHSFGGAVGSLVLLQVQYNLKVDWSRFSLYTYGQNRVGNVRFAKYYDNLNITVGRGVNYDDIIPFLFRAKDSYLSHFHNEIWIDNFNGTSYKFCSKKEIEDPKCSLSLAKKSTANHLKFFDTNFDAKFSC